ncbi:fimbrial protein [Ewingella sp. S1.OA.A_B6]
MKKMTLLSVSIASILFASQAFAASNNTVTFQGEVTSETCSVTINGNSAKPIVLLPTVKASALATAGSVAGQTTFDVGVSGCTGSTTVPTPVSSVFVGNNITTEGNLGNLAATDAATNVDIQILDTASKAIDFNARAFNGAGDLTVAAKESAATATYTAQYYATAAAKAGAVESTMQYAVSYN